MPGLTELLILLFLLAVGGVVLLSLMGRKRSSDSRPVLRAGMRGKSSTNVTLEGISGVKSTGECAGTSKVEGGLSCSASSFRNW